VLKQALQHLLQLQQRLMQLTLHQLASLHTTHQPAQLSSGSLQQARPASPTSMLKLHRMVAHGS